MLEHIFGSKARLKLLQIFLNNPGRAFYIRELARRLNIQLNSVRRELDTLQKLGIVLPRAAEITADSQKKEGQSIVGKEKKYYVVNEGFLLYPELKALFIKLQLVLEDDLLRQLEKIGKIYYLVLTGVFCGRPEIATDMLIVGQANKDSLRKIIKKFERELGHEVNFTLLSLREFKYRKEVTDRFLYSILENKKVILIDKISEGMSG